MIIHDCVQYSSKWWDIRKGVPTASRASKIITSKGALSTQCRGYINELIADSLDLGDPPIEPTEWMLRGLELEPEALAMFNFDTGLEATTVGFATNDDSSAGASPDALVMKDGMPVAIVEIKCPKPSTHIGYLLGGGLPDYYRAQVHWQMAICDLPAYFISYHPELAPLIVKVEPDEYTAQVAKAIEGLVINLADAKQRLDL